MKTKILKIPNDVLGGSMHQQCFLSLANSIGMKRYRSYPIHFEAKAEFVGPLRPPENK